MRTTKVALLTPLGLRIFGAAITYRRWWRNDEQQPSATASMVQRDDDLVAGKVGVAVLSAAMIDATHQREQLTDSSNVSSDRAVRSAWRRRRLRRPDQRIEVVVARVGAQTRQRDRLIDDHLAGAFGSNAV
jgi:hypothetical protein